MTNRSNGRKRHVAQPHDVAQSPACADRPPAGSAGTAAIITRLPSIGVLPTVWTAETRAQIEHEIRRVCMLAESSIVRAGELLTFAHAHITSKDEFADWVEEAFDKSVTWAYQMMTIAQKLAAVPQLTDGRYDKAKLRALTSCYCEDDLQYVAEHGTLPEVPKDEFDAMGAADLRRLARRNREQHTKGAQQLSMLRETVRKRNEEIDKLRSGDRPLPADIEQLKAELTDLDKRYYAVVEDLKRLATAVTTAEQAAAVRATATEYEQLMTELWERHLFPIIEANLGEAE